MSYTSYKLKACAMYYWRFNRNMLCAPEVDHMDIAAFDGEVLIETEIKISKNDLKQDFNKRKHRFFENIGVPYPSGRTAYLSGFTPNKFYFMVPPDIVDYCKELLEDKNKSKYGIITLNESRKVEYLGTYMPMCVIVKPAAMLHTCVSKKANVNVMKRLSAHITTIYMQKYWDKEVV